ncbi:SEC14-like protein 1 isoform X1 [Rhopilema esculentum]|uniref:SEC14-like protein 1 isoform X1 n=1 Tax=Rhopilema esculentum TaxID=499914 RepID=UPI0031D2B981
MVQEYQSPVRVYEHPFELVMAAYEKRFPTCPMIPAFLGSETVHEYKSDDGAIHIIERKCKLNVDAPYLVKKIAGVDYVYFIQRNSLNRRDRTLKIEAWNDSFASRVEIKEHCYYSVHQENPSWTVFEQDASLDVKNFFGFESAVEKLAIKAYTNNLKKGKEIILHYIKELISQGVTHIPPFESSKGRPRLLSTVEKQSSIERPDLEETIESEAEDQPEEPTFQPPATEIHPETIQEAVEPPPLQEYKLEDSFIERYLGHLSLIEESTLMKLRRKVAATHQGKMPDDAVMLRFLRARDCNLEKAFEMLRNTLHWRRQHHVDTILQTWSPPPELIEYYPGGWHKYDKDSRPIYLIRLGTMDIKGLLRSVGEEGFVKQVVSINEEGLKKCEEATRIFGKPVTSWTCLCDLEGLSMRHLWRPGVRAMLNIIEVVEANYPETIGRLLLVRAPRVFGVVWTLLSPFIDENSRKKFLIYSGNDYQGPGGLADYIPAEYIPGFLGGDCECDVVEGKTVPKAFHRFHNIGEGGESSWLGSDLYQTAQVLKGSPHEVMITVSEAESVITWDFDVIDGDTMFTVLRHKRPREASLNNVTTSGCLGESMTSRLSGIRPGIDAVVVERPILCTQGESVQGTHICTQPGVFILQWKYSSQTTPSRGAPRIMHKTKVMFYYEILPSREFRKYSMFGISSNNSDFNENLLASSKTNRGSMSSLESSQSAFSQLSIGTATTLSSGASAATNTSSVSR